MKNKLNPILFLVLAAISLIACGQKESKSQLGNTNSTKQIAEIKYPIQLDLPEKGADTFSYTNELPVIDVTKKHPEKEIYIQDIAEVTYILLETRDGFPFHGPIGAIDNEKIIACNSKGGNIFIFSKEGNIERIINKVGQGPEEYSEVNNLAYDNQTRELFLNNIRRKRVTVFDIEGNFKRAFNYISGKTYFELINFNEELIICDDSERNNSNSFFTISKTTGKLVKKIGYNFKGKISPRVYEKFGENQLRVVTFGYERTSICKDGLIINDLSSDTIFTYTHDKNPIPLLTRIPSVHSMTPAVVLFSSVVTNRFIFLTKIKKEFHYKEKENLDTEISIDQENILFDKVERKIYTPKIYNKDYSVKKEVDLGTTFNYGECVKKIPAYELVESYKKGELKGQLKEIASQLDINDNPVLIITRFKE